MSTQFFTSTFKIGDVVTHVPPTETRAVIETVNGLGRKNGEDIVFFRSGRWDYESNCQPKAKGGAS